MYASNYALKQNHNLPIGSNITESDKKKFLKKDCFKCKGVRGTISEDTCEALRTIAVSAKLCDPAHACLECTKYDKTLLRQPREKICELHKSFPGFCLGTGTVVENFSHRVGIFDRKNFCHVKCGPRMDKFKKDGYKKSEDVKGRVLKSYRPEMVG
jgi:hypothetical protein